VLIDSLCLSACTPLLIFIIRSGVSDRGNYEKNIFSWDSDSVVLSPHSIPDGYFC
jgi:hypothetical protein